MNRVALIRNSNSFDFGGAEIFPINLAVELIRLGSNPIVISAHEKTLSGADKTGAETVKGPWLSYQNFSGIRLLLFPVYVLWQLYLTAWYGAFAIKHRVGVFHPQSRDDFIAATLAGKILRKKVIWTDHADLKHVYANHGVWYKNPVGKLVYVASLLADDVTLESHSEANLISESLGKPLPRNYVVIHIGVIDTYKPIERKNSKTTFVSTSRLVRDKGIAELIKAFGLLKHKNNILKICGDGPAANEFKSLAKNIEGIEFLGHVNDVTRVLSAADIFVHPTYHEGFGLSLVEAEMCGLPVIASNVGSIPEIVQDNVSGILVKPKSVDELAAAMNNLSENKNLRQELGQAGREIYLKKFQFDKIVEEKFIPLYEEATKN